MSGFENFWNFKTLLDHQDGTMDEQVPEARQLLRSGIPLFSTVKLSTSEFYQFGEDGDFHKPDHRAARDEKFVAALQKLEQLTVGELQDLRRKIALHSHPDLKFKTGMSDNVDLMSEANGLIDDEIKRRS